MAKKRLMIKTGLLSLLCFLNHEVGGSDETISSYGSSMFWPIDENSSSVAERDFNANATDQDSWKQSPSIPSNSSANSSAPKKDEETLWENPKTQTPTYSTVYIPEVRKGIPASESAMGSKSRPEVNKRPIASRVQNAKSLESKKMKSQVVQEGSSPLNRIINPNAKQSQNAQTNLSDKNLPEKSTQNSSLKNDASQESAGTTQIGKTPSASVSPSVVIPTQIQTKTASTAIKPAATPSPSTTSKPTTTTIAPDTAPIIPSPLVQEATDSPSNLNPKGYLINFNNVNIIEYIRFISKITGRNFTFNEPDLDFNVTIISEEPATVEDIIAALLQELRIHDLFLMEEGNNIVIHRNEKVNSPSTIVTPLSPLEVSAKAELVTRVFHLNTSDPSVIADIIRPLLSTQAIVESVKDTSQVIVTDITSNVTKIAKLIQSLDSPESGYDIGQYVVKNSSADTLILIAQKILAPIAKDKNITFVPHVATNSIFVVSTPFLVDRAVAVLHQIDVNQGSTRVMSLHNLKYGSYDDASGEGGGGAKKTTDGFFNEETGTLSGLSGSPESDAERLRNLQNARGGHLGSGGMPDGGLQDFTQLGRQNWASELPLGHIANTEFHIYRLQYRRGDQIEVALQKIADSLQQSEINTKGALQSTALITTIRSVQWLEASNSLVFTGTLASIEKMKEFIEEIDQPLQQVFLDMLILDTSIADALTYAVESGSRFGGPGTAGAQGFDFIPVGSATGLTPTAAVLNTANDLGTSGTGVFPTPMDASAYDLGNGYSLGIIGRSITHGGTTYGSLTALVNAVSTDAHTDIILNPKILVEDNNPAEVFVGQNLRFLSQSIVNNNGNVVSSNFDNRDVGTTLKVTPHIGVNGIVTLDISQEDSQAIPDTSQVITGLPGSGLTTGPNLTKSSTKTRVHVPNDCFVIISGIMHDQTIEQRRQVPCLGGIPVLGALFKETADATTKRNVLIFIRPHIVETCDELDDLTERNQNIWKEKDRRIDMWKNEVDGALDFLNLAPDDRCCD